MGLRTKIIMLMISSLCSALMPSGCKKGGSIAGDTAAGTAEAFAAALNAGDLKAAASAFDYITAARQQNENWDDIPKGQRDLIVKKVMEEKADEISGFKTKLGGNIKCGPVDQGSTVALTGDAGSISVELVQVEGKWYVGNVW